VGGRLRRREPAIGDRVNAEAKVSLLPAGPAAGSGRGARLAERQELILVCGRYEGVDERLIKLEVERRSAWRYGGSVAESLPQRW
jgi:tRNA (guanine-N1)-methyltransferase